MTDFTLDTYNKSANALAQYFTGIGARTNDINAAFTLINKLPSALNVLELGCGDGRDAVEITPRVKSYVGTDYSEVLIEIAKARKIKNAQFLVQDMKANTFSKENKIDIIFAFASMLHLNKEEIADLFKRSAAKLSENGLWYISLKHRDHYQSEIKKDKYGERLFYFYNPDEIAMLAKDSFTEVSRDFQSIGDTNWFTIVLKK